MILSVSRRTDIPNYYSDWFIERIKEGFLYVRNPINKHQISKINLSPYIVDCIIFWTKNPKNIMSKLEYLKEYTYYFQFTITGYGKDVEPNIPDKKKEIIKTFQNLSKKIGKEKVIWRYDPIFINKKYTIEYHLRAFDSIASKLENYTEKVIISFIDIYNNMCMTNTDFEFRTMTDDEILTLAKGIVKIAEKHNLKVETCAERYNLQNIGIHHGSCIDKELIEKILGCNLIGKRDKNQRKECRCFESIDIGTYNTCMNGCKYCYANFNKQKLEESIKLFDKTSPLLCGKINYNDEIVERKMESLKDNQLRFF